LFDPTKRSKYNPYPIGKRSTVTVDAQVYLMTLEYIADFWGGLECADGNFTPFAFVGGGNHHAS
jgi:hypothetical protein